MNEEMLQNEEVQQEEVLQSEVVAEGTAKKKTGLATAALVLGIISIITVLFVINYVFAIIGLILAIAYLVKKDEKPAKGKAIAGLVCAILSIVISTGVWGGLYIYLTQTSVTALMEDVNKFTGGKVNPKEIINETITTSLGDTSKIEAVLGKELNYDTICEFVGEEVSVSTIQNFVGEGIDAEEASALISNVDGSAVIEDLGGELTYKALQDKMGKDFTYEDLKAYLENFKK